MHPDLIAALKAGWPIVHLVTVSLPDHTIRWTDAGFVRWGANTWKARDPIYGTLDAIGDIVDGIDDDASPVSISIIPPDLASLEALASSDAQGGWVIIHLAAVDPVSGDLVTPYQLHLGELDQPRLMPGKTRLLEYDIITGDARGLLPNEEQRQSDAFRRLIWPGERGDEYATDGTKLVYWREDEPRNAIGVLGGRGGGERDNKAIEFSYEPNAPLTFPFGRVGVGGTLRYRVGYGPTNRFQSVVATVGASGPVKGLVSVSFDDEVTTFDGNNASTNGSHKDVLWFKFLPGAQPSPALTSPSGGQAHTSPAPGWTADHKLSGRPCFMWTGKENSKKSEYQGGIPKPVLTLEGLYGYDPLLDSSRGGVGACRLDNPQTWPWVQEGARVALNWAIGRWEGASVGGRYGVPYQSWAVGGIAAPIQTIDVQAFAVAAQIADANGWKVAGAPRSDEDKVDVLDDLLKASGALRARRCGMISCVSFGAPTASVLTATEADTKAAPEISLAPSRLDRKNTGIPSFLSEHNRWEITPVAAVSDVDWFNEDGGRHTEGYEYKYVPSARQAAQLCYLEIANGREKIEADVSFKPWMMRLEPGNAFDWNAPEYGLTDTKVRVWKRTWSPRACAVKIKFRQETDAKYAKAFEQTGAPPPPFAPALPPVVDIPAARPIWTSIPFPITGDVDTITVWPHDAMMPWGEVVSIAQAVIGGLDSTKIYGVFWREGDGIEVEAYPAPAHMGVGSWIFLGWQSPSDALGVFPPLPVAPPGNGGTGPAPGLPIAGGLATDAAQELIDEATRQVDDKVREATEALEVALDLDGLFGGQDDLAEAVLKLGRGQTELQRIIETHTRDGGKLVKSIVRVIGGELENAQGAIVEEARLSLERDRAEAEIREALALQVDDNRASAESGISALVSDMAAQVTALDAMGVRVGLGEAALSNEASVRASETELLSQTLALMGVRNGLSSGFILNQNTVQWGEEGTLAQVLSALRVTDGQNSSSITTLLQTTADQASQLTTVSNTVAGQTSSVSMLLSAVEGLGARWTLGLFVNGAATALVADGQTRSLAFSGSSFAIIDDGNGLSYRPATGRLQIEKGNRKIFLSASGGVGIWAGSRNVPDGSELVDNGTFGISDDDAWFGGRTLAGFFSPAVSNSAVVLSDTAWSNVQVFDMRVRMGGFAFFGWAELRGAGIDSGDGPPPPEAFVRIVSMNTDGSDVVELVAPAFITGSLINSEWVRSQTAAHVRVMNDRTGTRRIVMQARRNGANTSYAEVRRGEMQFYYLV